MRDKLKHIGTLAGTVFLVTVMLLLAGSVLVTELSDAPDSTDGDPADRSIGAQVLQPIITIGLLPFSPDPAYAAGTADYTCDGVADDDQHQDAMDALPATGGRLSVFTGTYTFTAAVTRAINNVTVEGTGLSTVINRDGVNPVYTAGGNGWVFRDLATDAGGINMGATTGWQWMNVQVGATLYKYRDEYTSIVGDTVTTTEVTLSGENDRDLGDATTPIVARIFLKDFVDELGITVTTDADNLTWVTDEASDQVQFEAACGSVTSPMGITVWVSPGIAYINDDIDIEEYHVRLLGSAGRSLYNNTPAVSGGTVIWLADNSDCDMVTVTGDKCKIQDIAFYGNKANQTGFHNAIHENAGASSDLWVDGCYFWNVGLWGLLSEGHIANYLTNCIFESSGDAAGNDGGGAKFTGDDVLVDNVLTWWAEIGLEFNTTTRAVANNLQIIESARYGLRVDDSTGINVTNFVADGCASSFFIGDSTFCNIDCTSYESGNHASLAWGVRNCEISLDAIDCGQNAGTHYGLWLNTYDGQTSQDNIFKVKIGPKVGATGGIHTGIYCSNANQDNNFVYDGDLTGCQTAFVNLNGSEGWEFRGNDGYIGIGEIRTIQGGPVTGAGASNELADFQNPFAQDVIVKEVYVYVSTADGDNPDIDIGIDGDGAGAPDGGAFFTNLDGGSTGAYWSLSNGLGGDATGVQTDPLVLGDNGGANDWIVMYNDATADASSFEATWQIILLGIE